MKSNNEELENIKWGGFLNEFLWICCGVNRKVLRQCPTDYAKYAGMGGTILFTALMACLSGSYALYTVFESKATAIAFGIFWGALIFNLDRFIVNTMYSDGKVTISWREFTSGLPRIIMAIFLGIVISTPLEMKIFEDRIDSQLVKDNIMRTNATRQEVTKGNTSLIQRRDKLESEHKAIEQRLAVANEELKKEGEGSALSGKAGHGLIYKDKERNLSAIEKELQTWETTHAVELKEIREQIAINTDKANRDIEKGNEEKGFCVRYEAFSHLKSESTELSIVSLVIMLLFIIIETAPTFFKMMIASGPYDDMLRAEMYRVRVLADKQISDLNDDINTEVTISTERNRHKLEAEMKANEDLMSKIALAQSEILNVAIDEWRKNELKKVEENPSAYIQSNVPDNEEGITINA